MAKNNITLQLRLPADIALLILGRLYGCGVLTREQYNKKVRQVSYERFQVEQKRTQRLSKLFEKIKEAKK